MWSKLSSLHRFFFLQWIYTPNLIKIHTTNGKQFSVDKMNDDKHEETNRHLCIVIKQAKKHVTASQNITLHM